MFIAVVNYLVWKHLKFYLALFLSYIILVKAEKNVQTVFKKYIQKYIIFSNLLNWSWK